MLCYTGSKDVDFMPQFLSQLPALDLPSYTWARLRNGRGRLTVLMTALSTAGYELRPSPHALTARMSMRAAARRSGLSRNTLAALSRGEGTIHSYLSLAEALRVQPRIIRRASYAACLSSQDHTWTTPMTLITQILQAAGQDAFDLDPCSPSSDGPIPARCRWTALEDGLQKSWAGLVFCNPPYGRRLAAWVAHCATQAARGAVVIALIPARPDTGTWHTHIARQAAVLMLRGRLRFGTAGNVAPFPSALVVWGSAALAARIAHHVPGSWHIPAP